MTTCLKCGMAIPQAGRVCPHCGLERSNLTPAGCVLVVLLVGGFVGYSCWNESSERAAKRDQELVDQANRDEDLRLERRLQDELKGKAADDVSARLGAPSHRSGSKPDATESWSYTDRPKPWLCVDFKGGVVDDVRIISVPGSR